MANIKLINVVAPSTETDVEAKDAITRGDVSAYILRVRLLDLERIDGAVELRFVLPDEQFADRTADEVSGNEILHMLTPELYSQLGELKCYVRLMDNHLFTPLLIRFTGIRDIPGNVEHEGMIQSYPEWAEEVKEIVESLTVAGTYVHHQEEPSNRWVIPHELGYNPNVTTTDSSRRVVLGEVTYPDENRVVEVNFSSGFAGKAYLS